MTRNKSIDIIEKGSDILVTEKSGDRITIDCILTDDEILTLSEKLIKKNKESYQALAE